VRRRRKRGEGEKARKRGKVEEEGEGGGGGGGGGGVVLKAVVFLSDFSSKETNEGKKAISLISLW